MKQIYVWLLMLFSAAGLTAQTTLISPTGDGGFENGSTFAANGWTVSNSSTNPWVVAPFSNGSITGNAAFISNNGTTPAYSITNIASNYFWRDVTVPAGEGKIKLTFNWVCNGESAWDLFQVFTAPTSVTPTGSTTYPGSGATTVPAPIAGATFITVGQTQGSVQTTTVFLPSNLAGTTFRLIFYWKNDGSGGTAPPAEIDNISLTSAVPGNFVSVATGNWNTASTWDINDVPSPVDNVTVSTGHIVTLDASGSSINNLTVNGTLAYGSTPPSFSVLENLTVNSGGSINVFNGTTGKTLLVKGNIINDGNIDVSVGTGSAGNLTLNGTAVQSVSGSGTFGSTNVIRNLTFSNTNTSTPNINWSINNIKIAYNLSMTGARVNLGTNKMTFGSGAAGNTLTAPSGTGFLPGGKFSRYWSAGATGTSVTAGIDPTNTTSRYPFISTTGADRSMYISRTNSTGAVAGEMAATYTDATTITSGLTIADGTYTINERFDGNWTVSNEGTAVSAASYTLVLLAPNAIQLINGNARVMKANAILDGTHQNGTSTPGAQRITVSQADLLAGPLYIGAASEDIPFTSIANGEWNAASTWNKGVTPTCNDIVRVAANTTVTSSTADNVAKNITVLSGGTLNVTAGTLKAGCSLNNNFVVNNGTLNVSGGSLTVNGNLMNNAGATFNHSAGDVIVDGNDGTTAGSVATGTPLVRFTATAAINLQLTAGTLTIVDPHYGTSTTDYALSISQGTAANNAYPSYTVKFGDGVSTTAGGNTYGFGVYLFAGAKYYTLGSVTVDALTGTNRFVRNFSQMGIYGNLNIVSGEVQVGSSHIFVSNNIVNNGIFTNASNALILGIWYDGGLYYTPFTQTISGTGIFRNSLTTSTASLLNLQIANENTTGVTLNVPLSVSNVITLSKGIVNTTTTNILTLGTDTAAGTLTLPTAGGDNATHINGPFLRTIASGNANSNYIHFPVGKSGYAPIWLAPATTAVSQFRAEAFSSNTGTNDGSLINMSTTRRWEAPNTSGAYTNINVKLGDTGIVSTSIPSQAPSAAGVYTSSFGSVATYAAGTPNTTQSNTVVASENYTGYLTYSDSNACTGTPAPGNTLATNNPVCSGNTVVLSLQNTTVGSGVTYQWKYSADNVAAYTNVTDATGPTYSFVPTAEGYYKCTVTCATGSTTADSAPVHITFTNTVTSTTPGTRCGIGTVNLAAVASNGVSLSWYADQTGGAPLAEGTSFTTPSISATTTYYVAAESPVTGTTTTGTGSTTTSTTGITPYTSNWEGARIQYLFTAAELKSFKLAAGDITALAFNVTTAGNFNQTGYTVKMAHTAAANLTGGFGTASDEFITVYGPVVQTPPTVGMNTLSFTQPFSWDGVSSIIIEICHDNDSSANTCASCYGTNSTVKASTTSFNSVYSKYADDNTLCGTTNGSTITTFNVRPDITFSGEIICSSPRVAVEATVTPAPAFSLSSTSAIICDGASSPLVTITTGASDYNTYTWVPATGVSGDATNGWIFDPSTSTSYELQLSNTVSGCASTTNYNVTVNALPQATSITPNNPEVCANAIQPLTVNLPQPVSSKIGIGTSTNTISTPFKGYWGGSKTQALYTAAELTALGLQAGHQISSIGYVALSGTPLALNGFTVNAGFVSAATLGTDFIAGANTVVYAPATYTPSTGTGNIDFTLSTPITWDGTSNLLIETCFNNNNGGGSSSNSISVESSTVASGLNLYRSQDNTADVCSNTTLPLSYTTRPNLRLSAAALLVNTWSPVTNLYTDASATVPYTGTDATTVYLKSNTLGAATYTVVSTNSNNCSVQASTNVTIKPNTTLALTSGETVQTVYEGTAITDIVYTVTNGTNATVTGLPTGVTATYTAGTVTISGTPTIAGVYNYSVVGTGECAESAALTGTITVKSCAVNWANLQWPATATITTCDSHTVYAQVYKETITEAAGPGAGITAWIGYSTTNSDPSTWTEADWHLASFNTAATGTGNNDEYMFTMSGLSAGTYYIASRFKYTCGDYYYGGYNATGGGAWDGTNNVNASVTVNGVNAPTGEATQSFCGSANITQLVVTGTNVKWYDAATGGNQLPNSTAIGLVNGSTYYASQTVDGCESQRFAVTVVITNALAPIADASQTVCNSGTLADLEATGTNIQWYAATTGGTVLPNTTALVSGTTYYASQTVNGCESPRTAVTVTISNTAAPSGQMSQFFCSTTSTLADIVVTGANIQWYATATGGTALATSTILISGTTYYASQTVDGCESTTRLAVTVTVGTPAPLGAATQTFEEGHTLADLVVTGTNIVWYASQADALAGINPLPLTTLLVNGTTYYATQTANGCTSTLTLAVTVTVILANDGFDSNSFNYYPNPVSDMLTINRTQGITSVRLITLIGQEVSRKVVNANTTTLDMTGLPSGTYLLEVSADTNVKTFKVIKQ